MPSCPACHASDVIKNGSIKNGTPKFACKACGRQFVENSTYRRISAETRAMVDKLLLERMSLAGIVRVTGVSLRWLQYYVKENPRAVDVSHEKKD